MRKLNATLVLGLVALFSVATACGDDDGTSSPGKGEAGESAGGSGSDGPTPSGGSKVDGTAGDPANSGGGNPSSSGGESSGSGGDPSSNGGQATGKGGQATGEGGEPSGNGGNPTGNGGEPSGNGGNPTGDGGADGSGPVTCTAITLGEFGQAEVTSAYAEYATGFTPNVSGAGADVFYLSFQAPPDYDGGETGTFDLTENGDDNYKTCARCVMVVTDPGTDTRKVFYVSEGTLEIEAGSKQLGGTIDATLSNLKLIEVTIANDLTSTPVANGACLTVASATVAVEAPPCEGFECENGYCIDENDPCDGVYDCRDRSDELPGNPSCVGVWVCPANYIGDGDCDCGCGALDTDCTSTTDEGECEFCVRCQNNFDTCADGEVDPADTTVCL